MRFLFYFVLIFYSHWHVVQAITPGQTPQAFKTAISSYTNIAESHALLYQGIEQIKYPLHYLNDPYFTSSEYVPGEIWYKGVFYPEVMIRFDMYRNELIVRSPEPPYNIVINPEIFDSAHISGFRIVFLPQAIKLNTSGGAYCVLAYSGNVKLYMQPEAILRKFTEDRAIKFKFERINNYHIEKAGVLYPVNNLRSLLKIFPDKKQQINAFVKARKLNFRRNPSETMVEDRKSVV